MSHGPWRATGLRPVLWQVVAVVAVGAVCVFAVSNTLDNLADRGIASGFGFMSSTAGFGIGTSLIAYDESSTMARAFFVGLLNTLLVSVLGILIATVVGTAVGIARLSSNWLLARITELYVEVLRNIPLLLQIFFWYFAVLRTLPSPRGSHAIGDIVFLNNRGLYLPGMEVGAWFWALLCVGVLLVGVPACRRKLGTAPVWFLFAALVAAALATAEWTAPVLQGFNFRGGIVLSPEFVALTVALSTYTAAFVAEVVRAGIQAVPRGQVEAARALGLRPGDVMRKVVLPQALRVIVPPLTNQYLNLTKNSSLAAAIAYPDLVSVFAGTALSITGQAVEMIALVMAVYLVISLSIALGMNIYNRAIALRGA